MRYLFAISWVWFFLISVGISQESVTILTYNIRLDAASDGIDNWHERKVDFVEYLNKTKPSFIGIQEGLSHQVQYLTENLHGYKYIGVGRDDGYEGGEFMAIYYDTLSWALDQKSTFWLSSTQSIPSRGWDAACHRTCTVGLFRNMNGKEIYIFNTHLDHQGKVARAESIDLLIKNIKTSKAENIILTGDFNFEPSDPNYTKIADALFDAYTHAEKKQAGMDGTFNAFKLNGDYNRRIDYIFSNRKNILSYTVDTPYTNKGRHLSDHFPVIVQIRL